MVATACPLSVSTRRSEELAESLGVTQPPKSQVRKRAPCPRADWAGPERVLRTGLLDPRLCQPMEGTGSRAGSGVTAFGLGAGVTGTGT